VGAVVSLELVLDARTDASVRREWALLKAAGPPSQARHTGASNRPHVTLLVRSALHDLPGAEPIASHVVGIRRWSVTIKTVSHVVGRGTLEPC
jgi:hypothetical protein